MRCLKEKIPNNLFFAYLCTYISKQDLFNYASCQTFLEMRKKADIQCVHTDKVNPKIQGNTKGSEECEKIGSSWVHLRFV
jgi:hypothetical protein